MVASDAGRRLLDVLGRCFPDLGPDVLRAAVSAGGVHVDGRRELDGGRRLGGGERLVLFVPEAGAAPAFAVRHEDPDLLVVDKPSGLPSQRDRAGGAALDLAVAARFGPSAVRMHRLDRGASGLVVFARTAAARRALQAQLEDHSLGRIYMAACAGDPPERGRIAAPVAGKPAATRFERVRLLEGGALLRLELETGRTHQIRVHLAASGFPILGDERHAPEAVARRAARLLLHAEAVELAHPRTGARLRVTAPLPPDFLAALPPPR